MARMSAVRAFLGIAEIVIGFFIMIGPLLVPPVQFFAGDIGFWGQILVGALVIIGGFETLAGH